MAISMTGFGRGEYKDDNYQFLVECKTINHKYADINIRLPIRGGPGRRRRRGMCLTRSEDAPALLHSSDC